MHSIFAMRSAVLAIMLAQAQAALLVRTTLSDTTVQPSATAADVVPPSGPSPIPTPTALVKKQAPEGSWESYGPDTTTIYGDLASTVTPTWGTSVAYTNIVAAACNDAYTQIMDAPGNAAAAGTASNVAGTVTTDAACWVLALATAAFSAAADVADW
jgi:hypothetical protein